jgi:hypothetical protein
MLEFKVVVSCATPGTQLSTRQFDQIHAAVATGCQCWLNHDAQIDSSQTHILSMYLLECACFA